MFFGHGAYDEVVMGHAARKSEETDPVHLSVYDADLCLYIVQAGL